MERLKKMQKHFSQHYLTLIGIGIDVDDLKKTEIYLDDMILDSDDSNDADDEATENASCTTTTKSIRT